MERINYGTRNKVQRGLNETEKGGRKMKYNE